MSKNSTSNQSTTKSRPSRWHWAWERVLPSLPSEPGIYFFLSAKKEVLYIGKSGNLRRRLRSYRGQNGHDPKTKLLLSQAKLLKWTIVESDLDAIISEAELIRTHQPKFNLRLKDDKTPLYILLTKEEFPRVLMLRKTQLPDYPGRFRIFGPYTSAYQTRIVIRLVRRIFPFCNATPRQKQHHIACFYSHINRCPGACTGRISPQEYARNINGLKQFLMGRRKSLAKSLKGEMQSAAKELNFERARTIRDQLMMLEHVTQAPVAITWLDGVGAADSDHFQSRMNLWKTLAPFIEKISARFPQKPFARIEAYDISNLGGKQSAGSMVVFTQGKPDISQYRRFRIRQISQGNDPKMMEETIQRRIAHREWQIPDLIVVDGGTEQVKAARQALASKGLQHSIPVIGIAKRFEELVIFKQIFHFIRLPKDSASLLLIMHIRDEAHRFAKRYHTLLREKTLINN